jgi:hypothetical protein
MSAVILWCGLTIAAVFPDSSAIGQTPAGVDPEALITQILATDAHQREQVHDVTFESQYIEGEEKKEGFKEKARFNKKVQIKYLKDTTLYHEEYLEYYKEGELQSMKDCAKAGEEKMNKKKRRKSKDISYNMVEPFYEAKRPLYEITYKGIAEARIDGRSCHHFVVKAKEPDEQLVNGDYYFEAETFHLAKVDFSPSKMMHTIWFNFSKLNMSISYAPTPEGWWLPNRFFIEGKAKATLFIGVNFGGTEYFRNPVINAGLDDKIFEVSNDD